MNRTFTLLAWIIGSFALSCYALVIIPQKQLGKLEPVYTEDEGKLTDIYPVENRGIFERGRAVYNSEGCVYCHSQQVRDVQNGMDIPRGWGVRRTVARDYVFDNPPFIGSTRLGPDLANVGSPDWRNEAPDDPRRPAVRNASWQMLHLYAPASIIKESNMPPYRYLFEKRKVSGQRSADALELTGKEAPEPGYEIVPKASARALVGYLMLLDRSHPVPEVKPAAPAVAKK